MVRNCCVGLLALSVIGLAGCPCTSDWTRYAVQGLETEVPTTIGQYYAPDAGNGPFPARFSLINAPTAIEGPRYPIVFHNQTILKQRVVDGITYTDWRYELGCDYLNSSGQYQYYTILYDDPELLDEYVTNIETITSLSAALCGDVIYVPYLTFNQTLDEPMMQECYPPGTHLSVWTRQNCFIDWWVGRVTSQGPEAIDDSRSPILVGEDVLKGPDMIANFPAAYIDMAYSTDSKVAQLAVVRPRLAHDPWDAPCDPPTFCRHQLWIYPRTVLTDGISDPAQKPSLAPPLLKLLDSESVSWNADSGNIMDIDVAFRESPLGPILCVAYIFTRWNSGICTVVYREFLDTFELPGARNIIEYPGESPRRVALGVSGEDIVLLYETNIGGTSSIIRSTQRNAYIWASSENLLDPLLGLNPNPCADPQPSGTSFFDRETRLGDLLVIDGNILLSLLLAPVEQGDPTTTVMVKKSWLGTWATDCSAPVACYGRLPDPDFTERDRPLLVHDVSGPTTNVWAVGTWANSASEPLTYGLVRAPDLGL